MNHWSKTLGVVSVILSLAATLHAEDVLFIGNSFTYVNNIPKLRRSISMRPISSIPAWLAAISSPW